ncbi:MAG: hypothetical protein COU98_01965 [Candidatus Staskawiczbacteria bacterium CG10_big_fil_rev_8_21_14_0_10_38_10]|uniref:Uncharacterized protein n=1 Tax=Candidatus Staskawiczbacteria bacterium CG10_big_fil_rev_8_21_14_0_10_38_10 TaxID=1974891 RepID=A0A2H9T1A8_9BACT|nr:MAG: hypothetical protein COU98_01965 [Candidatus Staskawiczbacteria bacterium CG10_big_fil_rev_8_21_14_0_10_38_10]
MAAKAKLLIAVVIIIVIAIIFGYYYFNKKTTPEAGQGETILPKATGNIDDAANAMLGELTDVETTLSDVDGDVFIVVDDGKEISDFGQSYNENEF